MTIVICPGIHDAQLTHSFLARLDVQLYDHRVFPTDRYAAYSGVHILKFLWHELVYASDHIAPVQDQEIKVSLLFIGFSAGVAGAIAAAGAWQLLGGEVKAFIALDGWGVPLYGDFPIYRLSHDYFTHWSSALLGRGVSSFYADPPVPHLELWRSPHTAIGYAVNASTNAVNPLINHQTTAAKFLSSLLIHHGEAEGMSAE